VSQSTIQYKDDVPEADGKLKELLGCIANCGRTSITVTSTSEAIPQHPDGTPHAEGEAADLRVPPKQAEKVLQCASQCGAGFGLNEFEHPSKQATGGHVHVQTGPGKGGSRGDLPPKPKDPEQK
jgi:hypothetical protein